MSSKQWMPHFSWPEKLKSSFIPPKLYTRHLLRKHLKYGESELNFLPFLVDQNKAAIDIGANKGIYTQALSELVSEVHSFEPNPKIYNILNAGSATNTTTHPVALSNVSHSTELLIPYNQKRKTYSNQGASLSRVKVSGAHKTIQVATRTLDSYEYEDIGFIKIDVEGHELAVLEGAKNTLSKNRPTLMIELEERHTGLNIKELIGHVESYGYASYFLRNKQLKAFEFLDPLLEHQAISYPERYVFNFIFLPTS